MTDPTKNVAETMRDVMAERGQIEMLDLKHTDFHFDRSHLVSVPVNRKVEDITDQIRRAAEFTKPARRKGTARLANLTSLIDWANRFKDSESVLYAAPDMTAPSLTCIADYHHSGPSDTDPTGADWTARHCHHRAIYDFPLSNEWLAWTGVDGKALEKDDLGEFIEAQAKDIMDPTPAILKAVDTDKCEKWETRLIATARQIEGRYGQLHQLLAMSRQFQVHESSNLTVKTNRDTGEQEIQFVNEHRAPDGTPLRLPNLLIVAIPVFQGGAPYRMPVRFRYRKQGGSVKFFLSIYNPEKAFESAFDEACAIAQSQTDLPLFFGAPER